jgi:hypothetical protein
VNTIVVLISVYTLAKNKSQYSYIYNYRIVKYVMAYLIIDEGSLTLMKRCIIYTWKWNIQNGGVLGTWGSSVVEGRLAVLQVRSSNPGSDEERFRDPLFVHSAISIRGMDKIVNLKFHIYWTAVFTEMYI